MTAEEKAREYHNKIIANNSQAEAWDFEGAYLAGYTEGYADSLTINNIPSNEVILKIIDLQLDLTGKLLVSDEEPYITYQKESIGLDSKKQNALYDRYIVKLIKEHWYDNTNN